MNRRSTAKAWYALPLILLAMSCASTPPKPAEPAPAPQPTVETPATVIPLPDEAKAAAEKARAGAASFGAETTFPADWKAASDLFAAGEKTYGVDNASSRASFEAAAKAFNELAEKAKPLFLDKLAFAKLSAERERQRALDLEARKYYPEEWSAAEAQFSGGEKAFNSDNDAARVSYEAAAKSFKALADKTKAAIITKIASARAKAEQRRKYAFDFEAQAAFPNEWKSAESTLSKGRDRFSAAESGAMPAYPESLAAYEAAFVAYDDLVGRSVPLFAAARKAELEKARGDAVAAKADALMPTRFAASDAASAEVLSLYGRGDHYAAHEAWKAARDRYLAMATGARAHAVKNEIDRRDFAAYDPGNYTRAGERLEAAMSAFDAGRIDAAKEATEEAHLRYRLALAKGFELYAGDRGKAAEAQRVAAFDLKAHVAVKTEYDAALKTKTDADLVFKSGKHEDAALQYMDAEKQFSSVRQTAAEKRKAAEEAINEAARRMQESEKTAKDADAVLEGGAR